MQRETANYSRPDTEAEEPGPLTRQRLTCAAVTVGAPPTLVWKVGVNSMSAHLSGARR